MVVRRLRGSSESIHANGNFRKFVIFVKKFPGVHEVNLQDTGISVAVTRIVRDDETMGSTPISPTNMHGPIVKWYYVAFALLSPGFDSR